MAEVKTARDQDICQINLGKKGSCKRCLRETSLQVYGYITLCLSILTRWGIFYIFSSVLFSVCPNGFYGHSCTDNCHCKDSRNCTVYGGCPGDECAPGWKLNNAKVNRRRCSIGKLIESTTAVLFQREYMNCAVKVRWMETE